ncbi:hypothetical protein [Streptomyces sp. FH025]|uniref:hypothetical protein n=1 Tax=Streptomyces sp. FH025 TaxID=2815937 RepID=UPI001A9F0012|nr:hypothetical protein [Streptomyces sp. FH025]MBO1418329.1 hypothetical protein [Streptomyces sp. FH025]
MRSGEEPRALESQDRRNRSAASAATMPSAPGSAWPSPTRPSARPDRAAAPPIVIAGVDPVPGPVRLGACPCLYP